MHTLTSTSNALRYRRELPWGPSSPSLPPLPQSRPPRSGRSSVPRKLGDDRLSSLLQVMECEDHQLLERWMANWKDLVEFEVIPVQTSADAAAAIAPQL